MQQFIDNYDFTGKKAIVRVDFNVPLNEKMEITDDTRIRAAIPTLKKVIEKGGAVIVMSHLGRPKGVTEKFSLKHILGRVEGVWMGKGDNLFSIGIGWDFGGRKK